MEKYYATSHEWAMQVDDQHVRVGISDYAQKALGDIVFLSTQEVGDAVSFGERFGDVESVKAVSELLSPVDGVVSKVNTDLEDKPELLNEDPLNIWIIEVEGQLDTTRLMSEEAYLALDKDH